jgi:2-dehydropantoate 2-reductase
MQVASWLRGPVGSRGEDRALKVCVVGAGAIGGFLGVQLARAGIDVSVVARGAHLAAIRCHGLRLEMDGSTHCARVPANEQPKAFGPQDYVILAVKAHQVTPLVEALKPVLAAHTTVVTATNGLPYWFFAGNVPYSGTTLASVDPGGMQRRVLGVERAVGCVVLPAAELVAPGVIRHEHGRKFPIGEAGGSTGARIQALHDMMVSAGLEAPIRSDIRAEIWLKLTGNVCFNPISALTGATIDVIATDPGTRAVCEAMMNETRAIGERLGLSMRVDIEKRLDGAAALGPHRMSMLQDLQRGRSMEIEPVVGVVSELGRITGVATPTVDTVLALVRQRAEIANLATEPTPADPQVSLA